MTRPRETEDDSMAYRWNARRARPCITLAMIAAAGLLLANAASSPAHAQASVEPLIMTPDAFDARIAKEAPLAQTLAKAAGIAVKQP
jgi:tripartite-type tricarboxylate transporter receptor subunit TctC